MARTEQRAFVCGLSGIQAVWFLRLQDDQAVIRERYCPEVAVLACCVALMKEGQEAVWEDLWQTGRVMPEAEAKAAGL